MLTFCVRHHNPQIGSQGQLQHSWPMLAMNDPTFSLPIEIEISTRGIRQSDTSAFFICAPPSMELIRTRDYCGAKNGV